MTAMSAQCDSAIGAANPFPDLPTKSRTDRSVLVARSYPRPRFGDYSRTRFESRVAFGGPDEGEDAEEVVTPTRRFSVLETTSGLPDDSREADARQEGRRLRDLRARVKAARAVVSTTPGLAETIAADWQKAARLFAQFGISESQFQQGVRETPRDESDNPAEESHYPTDRQDEERRWE